MMTALALVMSIESFCLAPRQVCQHRTPNARCLK
jgi:hypothetical protein